jgi:septum site-determining protein MinC
LPAPANEEENGVGIGAGNKGPEIGTGVQTAEAATTPSDGRHYPFQVRGSLQTILALRLIAPGDPGFFPLLHEKIAHAPDFYRDAPVVLDVAPVADTPPIDLAHFVEQLRGFRLVPVGIQNGTVAWYEAGALVGLARFGSGGTVAERRAEPAPARGTAPTKPAASARGPSRVVHEPVRGGQQIVASEGDLVVLGAVGHGAEVAAAGHIHIYGPLRGRAFAGIDGDEQAMIFCDQLEAELLSIAGVYMVNEAIDPRLINRRVRVGCDGERLVLAPVP